MYISSSCYILIYAIPVSYTHLDVYKRQAINRYGFLYNINDSTRGVTQKMSCNIFSNIRDVYKRQAWTQRMARQMTGIRLHSDKNDSRYPADYLCLLYTSTADRQLSELKENMDAIQERTEERKEEAYKYSRDVHSKVDSPVSYTHLTDCITS